jgi:hypothetical protein
MSDPGETLDAMKVHMSFERATKNTIRFAEDEDGQPDGHMGAPALVTLYLQKFAWARLGKPERITVEVTAR